jgi:hypothetical protein
MDAQHTSNTGQGNWIVFLIGAVFNVLAQLNFSSLVEHTVKMIIGGLAFLLVKALVEKLTPWGKGLLKKFWDFINGE